MPKDHRRGKADSSEGMEKSALHTVCDEEVMRRILGGTYELTKAIPRQLLPHTCILVVCLGNRLASPEDPVNTNEEFSFGCVSPGFIQKVPATFARTVAIAARRQRPEIGDNACALSSYVLLSWVSSKLFFFF